MIRAVPAHCVTVSVVSHGQWALAAPLLESLALHCAPWINKLVLTCNLPEQMPANLPLANRLVRIDNPEPRGFGANHNAAFTHCDSEWFLVLNPDIRIDCDVLAPLLAAAQDGDGLVAPRVQEPGKAAPEAHRRIPVPWELLARRLPAHKPPAHPEWVPGMFMMLRRETYAALAGFDERFHMYCEDVDLCFRLQLRGWRLAMIERVVVGHEAQRASSRQVQPLLWHVASLLRLWLSSRFRQLPQLRQIRQQLRQPGQPS